MKSPARKRGNSELGTEINRLWEAIESLRPVRSPGALTSHGPGGVTRHAARPPTERALFHVMVVRELRNALLCIRSQHMTTGAPFPGASVADQAAFLVAKPLVLRQVEVEVTGSQMFHGAVYGLHSNQLVSFLPTADSAHPYRRSLAGGPPGTSLRWEYKLQDASPQVRVIAGSPSGPAGLNLWVIEQEIDPPYLADQTARHLGSGLIDSPCHLLVQKMPSSPPGLWPHNLVDVTGENIEEFGYVDPPFTFQYKVPVKPAIPLLDVGGRKWARVKYVDPNHDARRWRDVNLNQLHIANLNDDGIYLTTKQ